MSRFLKNISQPKNKMFAMPMPMPRFPNGRLTLILAGFFGVRFSFLVMGDYTLPLTSIYYLNFARVMVET